MNTVKLTVNEQVIEVPAGITLSEAARSAAIYIPALCSHPDLPPAKTTEPTELVYHGERAFRNCASEEGGKACGLCLVSVDGDSDLIESCCTKVENGMVVITESDAIKAKRQQNLIPILARHRHACLTCAQQEGCSQTQCSMGVPENERCCSLFGHCELQALANHVGISDATPKWIPTDFPVFNDDPLFTRDYNLCIGCTRCVRVCRELKGVDALGFNYDESGSVQIGTIKPTLEESGCKFCTACVEVCPTGALMDKAVRAGREEEDIVACKEACPVHADIPGYLRLIAEGKPDEANAVIREKMPFPGILGRVCIHPCEDACRRGGVNESISICALKRYAADGEQGLWKKRSLVKNDTGKRAAIVGAGPAGLTAAFYLRKQGHSVTVFEAQKKPGGMMRYGIPAYRLPREILDKEIEDILSLGIEFQPNQRLGVDFSLDELKQSGYDAVFLSVGAQSSYRVPLDGSDSPDVFWGIDFLRQFADGAHPHLKDKVVVIGGGDVAIDVAQTAVRCGAKDVTMVCLESRNEMPAHVWEIESALAEGVTLLPSWGPHKILSREGGGHSIELIECTSAFDAQGNFSPTYSETYKTIETDQVIMAVGQTTDLSFLKNGNSVSVKNGLLVVDQNTLETSMMNVYAGGDAADTTGAAIVDAIAAGRKAASSIDRALGGSGEIDEVLYPRNTPTHYLGRHEGFASWLREAVPELGIDARKQGFSEVSLGYEDEQAVREATRCLQCDLRLYIGCNPSPPAHWLALNEENIGQVPETEGVFQLFDSDNHVLAIKGTANLRQLLSQEATENQRAVRFRFDEDRMYSQRESELIQQYLREHGEMPGGGDSELDDLF